MSLMFNHCSSPLTLPDVDPTVTTAQQIKRREWVGAGEKQDKEQHKLTLEVQSYQDLHTL
jgi:hypothetical protein